MTTTVDQVDSEVNFVPYVYTLLATLAGRRSLVLVMDGSEVGWKCVVLMLSVIYRNPGLPIAWMVVKGSKGHFPQQTHLALLAQVRAMIPPGADVIFVSDGEFDGTVFRAAVDGYGWHYVCRTAKNTRIGVGEDDQFPFQVVEVQPGNTRAHPR